MNTGLIGLALSGKTTLFNALTGSDETVGTGARKDHIANVKVPDKRIDKLSQVYKPKKILFSEINFVDFAGGFDSKTDSRTIAKIREMDCLSIVIGTFKSADQPQVKNELLEVLNEMILLDLLLCDKRIGRLEKESKKDSEYKTLVKLKEALEQEKFISQIGLSPEEIKNIRHFNFFTCIPMVVLINMDEKDYNKITFPKIEEICKNKDLEYLYLSGKLEMDIASLAEDEQKDFLTELGLPESAKDRFIQKAYTKMNLISFFTVGEDEVKSWTIKKDTPAGKAAGKIHSDIERGFIRAEVFSFADFVENQYEESKVKAAGKMRLEGKDYLVQDADIISFRFNV